MNNRKIRGPSIDPCGTPDVIFEQDRVDPLIQTNCY